jgi:hypothetical protein
VQAAKAIERANVRRTAEAEESLAVRAAAVKLQNEAAIAKAKAAWARECEVARLHYDNVSASAAAEEEAQRVAVVASNDEVTTKRRVAWLDAVAERRAAWEAGCSAARAMHTAAMTAAAAHNEAIMPAVRKKLPVLCQNRFQISELLVGGPPASFVVGMHARMHGRAAIDKVSRLQVRAAEVASKEVARVAAFLVVLRAGANKAALGVNFVPKTPNLARVVEPATLSAALLAAYPELDHPECVGTTARVDALPWPARSDGSYKKGSGSISRDEGGWTSCHPPPPLLPDSWSAIRRIQLSRSPRHTPAGHARRGSTPVPSTCRIQPHLSPTTRGVEDVYTEREGMTGEQQGHWAAALTKRPALQRPHLVAPASWVAPQSQTGTGVATNVGRRERSANVGFSKGLARRAYPEIDIQSY